MDMTDRPNDREPSARGTALDRRAMLMGAAIAAGATVGASPVLADTVVGNFGAPLVDVQVPAGILTLEQKAAMIKGITDVVLKATKLPPDQAKKSFVQIFETAEGGFGVNGQVFAPRPK